MNGYGNEDSGMTIATPRRAVNCTYALGDVVYHRLTSERRKGLVTGVLVRPTGHTYLVTWPDRSESSHYEFELTTEFVPDYGATD